VVVFASLFFKTRPNAYVMDDCRYFKGMLFFVRQVREFTDYHRGTICLLILLTASGGGVRRHREGRVSHGLPPMFGGYARDVLNQLG
jgi:hypothetical protein